jgi:hypothetical protein
MSLHAPGSAQACPVCLEAAPRPFMHVDGRDYWRCDACEATFVPPEQRPTVADERAEYLLHQNDPDDPGYRDFLSRLVEPLLARLAPGAEGLDHGCGPGPALAMMLRAAKHRVAVYDPFFSPDTAVFERSYDFITCTEVAEHLHDPAAEFARFDRLLRPGGWLGVMTCFQTDDARFAGWHYRRDPTHVVFYRERTFHRIALRFGWQCEIPCKDVVLMHKPVGAHDCRPCAP